MSTTTSRNRQEDLVHEAASALEILIPTPETIWGDISKAKLKAADGDTMREICQLSFNDFHRLQHAIEPAARRMDMALFVRASVFKTEASKIKGFLDSEFELAKIAIANNTASDTALNAAVYRLLTRLDDARPDNKYRVSRNAKAIKGVEIIATDAGVPISIATAGEILRMVEYSTRSNLCKLVDERTKLKAHQAIDYTASSQDGDSKIEQRTVSKTGHSLKNRNKKPVKETTRQTVEAPSIVPNLAAEHELPALLAPGTVDDFPDADLHLVAVVRAGRHFVPKGLVCSGEKARALIKKAMAG